MSLAEERCQVCRPGTPALGHNEAAELVSVVSPAWELEPTLLRRVLKTADFATSLAMAVHIGMIAETEGHHPDLHVHWGRLVIELTTHAAKGLTRNDFILAAKIDRVVAGWAC